MAFDVTDLVNEAGHTTDAEDVGWERLYASLAECAIGKIRATLNHFGILIISESLAASNHNGHSPNHDDDAVFGRIDMLNTERLAARLSHAVDAANRLADMMLSHPKPCSVQTRNLLRK